MHSYHLQLNCNGEGATEILINIIANFIKFANQLNCSHASSAISVQEHGYCGLKSCVLSVLAAFWLAPIAAHRCMHHTSMETWMQPHKDPETSEPVKMSHMVCYRWPEALWRMLTEFKTIQSQSLCDSRCACPGLGEGITPKVAQGQRLALRVTHDMTSCLAMAVGGGRKRPSGCLPASIWVTSALGNQRTSSSSSGSIWNNTARAQLQ